MSHPILEIRFRQALWGDPDEEIEHTSYWYHLPRVGDHIMLDSISGQVQVIEWSEDHVKVHLKGRKR